MSDELPPDVADAIARCKEYQATRPGVPVAFYIVTSDEHVICMPPTIEANDRLSRMINNNQGKQDVLRWVETFCAEHIFWVRGQTGEGPKAAMEQLKKVRNGGDFVKADLFGDICSQVQTLLEQHKADLAKDRPTAKKY
jgi:hypothetical protein